MSFTMLLPTTNVFWCFGSDTIFTITRLYRYCFCCQIDFSFCGKLFMKWIVWWFCLLYTNMLWWCCNISFFNNFSFLYLTYHLILKWSESFFVSNDTFCRDWCFPVFLGFCLLHLYRFFFVWCSCQIFKLYQFSVSVEFNFRCSWG